jgi:hypothetical protein
MMSSQSSTAKTDKKWIKSIIKNLTIKIKSSKKGKSNKKSKKIKM